VFVWAVQRLDPEQHTVASWTLSLEEPLPGTPARAQARVSPKLLDEEMALFRQAQAQM